MYLILSMNSKEKRFTKKYKFVKINLGDVCGSKFEAGNYFATL